MGGRRFFPKLAAVIGVLAAAGFVAAHVNSWFFSAPDSGSHVQQDFAQAGFGFTPSQRIAGAVIEGLPALAYLLAFMALLPLLWSPMGEAAMVGRRLTRAGWLALTGAVLLAIYPVPASIAFSALEPGDAGMFLLSFQPAVIVAFLGSILFAAIASRIRDCLPE